MTPAHAASAVLHHALGHGPRLGATRLVCLDGPSGSGKSTLAAAIIEATTAPVEVVAVDDLFPGWDAAADLPHRVEPVLRALAAGRQGCWRRWDWTTGRWAEWHRVRAGGLLLLEGVGAGHRGWADLTTTLAWVEAPRSMRLERGVARDDGMSERWRRWQVREDAAFAVERTRQRADLHLWTG